MTQHVLGHFSFSIRDMLLLQIISNQCAHGTWLVGTALDCPVAEGRERFKGGEAACEALGTVKYYAQIHLQTWQNSVCTGQGNLPLIAQ